MKYNTLIAQKYLAIMVEFLSTLLKVINFEVIKDIVYKEPIKCNPYLNVEPSVIRYAENMHKYKLNIVV